MPSDQGCSYVYVVDDDASIRDSLDLFLGLQGFKVRSYPSGEAFLAAYRPDWTGCLVLDLHLAGMSGIELLRRMSEMNIRLPTIVATSELRTFVEPIVAKHGALAVLEKPIDNDRLVALIHQALGN